jgi:hypothetical protein
MPSPPTCEVFFFNCTFLSREFVNNSPKHKPGGPQFHFSPDCLFNIFAPTLHVCRPFLHPQREDAPCRGDKDRHTTESVNKQICNRSKNFFRSSTNYHKRPVLFAYLHFGNPKTSLLGNLFVEFVSDIQITTRKMS